MTKFGPGEWFDIAGRGHVYSTYNPEECDDFSHLLNKEVEIEGNIYMCTGVEFMGFSSFRKGRPIGILVRGPKREPKV